MNLDLTLSLSSRKNSGGGSSPAGFDPSTYYTGGDLGFAFIPATLSSMWQDAAGTIAAGDSDPIGRFDDLSGSGWLATQPDNDALRPTLNEAGGLWSADFAGDFLYTASVNLNSQALTVVAATYKVKTSTAYFIDCESAQFYVTAPASSATNYGARADGFGTGRGLTATAPASPSTDVITYRCDGAGDYSELRVNGAVGASSSASHGTSTLASSVLRIGIRANGTKSFSGGMYGVMLINRYITDEEMATLEAEFATLSGVTLP